MTLGLAVWLVILGALVLSNLPFLLNRPLAPWPWVAQAGAGGAGGVFVRWLACLLWLAVLALWSWATIRVVGGSFAGGGSSSAQFLLKLLASIMFAAGLLYLPGWLRSRTSAATAAPDTRAATAKKGRRGASPADAKPFINRFLEVLVGYVLVGTMGLALELNMGNAFRQGWEFYAVSLSLFLVLAYPGFVWRYMLRRRR